MKHISAKSVPKLLGVMRKDHCLAVATDLLQCADQDINSMKTIITGDESWVYGYNPDKSTVITMEDLGVSKAKKYTKFGARLK